MGTKLVRRREHTFKRSRIEGVVVSRIDFTIPGGGTEPGTLAE